jgi:hypothetical protein
MGAPVGGSTHSSRKRIRRRTMAEEMVLSSDGNALADLKTIIGEAQPLATNETFDTISTAVDYFPRLQLCGSSSTLFKKNKIPKQHYASVLTDDKFNDLGLSVDILPLAWRPKALDMTGDTPLSCYDEKSATFKDIQTRSAVKDSKCAFGPEFLVWIPTIKTFACLFMGSKTARSEAGKVRELLSQGATLNSTVLEAKGYIWEAIVVNPCTTPFELPSAAGLRSALEKFQAEAKAVAPERAETNTTSRSR